MRRVVNTMFDKQMQDLQNAMKTIQEMKGLPGMEQALKQMQEAYEIYAKQVEHAGQGGCADIKFTQITSGPLLKQIDDNHVEFGSYPQTAGGGVKKILWRVLEYQPEPNEAGKVVGKDASKAVGKDESSLSAQKDRLMLLLSEDILEFRYWHSLSAEWKESHPATWKKEDILSAMIPWEMCSLRKWLNGYFYENAFNAAEKDAIEERLNTGNGAYMHHDYVPKKHHKMNNNILTTDSYRKYEERGCGDTKDNVFLLSVEEAIYYFGKSVNVPNTVWIANHDRTAKPTEYIRERGFYEENTNTFRVVPPSKAMYYMKHKQIILEEFSGNEGYWLRSAGANDLAMIAGNCPFHSGQLSFISNIGAICAGGQPPASLGNGVRPAILVRNL